MQKQLWFWVPKNEDENDKKWIEKRVLPKIDLDPEKDSKEMFDGWFYRQVAHGAIVPLTSSLPTYFDSMWSKFFFQKIREKKLWSLFFKR